ncbi:MAG: hypothetical protein LBG04_02320 [Holosporaceae bacterium]|nr:hypothetical protein [Holosporaceae bacterium]
MDKKYEKQPLDKNLPTRNKYSVGDVLGNDLRNFVTDFEKNATGTFCCNMRGKMVTEKTG